MKSVAKGAAGSARYLYCDEISDLCSGIQSLIVYQHFPREKRAPYLERQLSRLAQALPDHAPFAIHDARVAYLVAGAPHHEQRLRRAADDFARRWEERVTIVAGEIRRTQMSARWSRGL